MTTRRAGLVGLILLVPLSLQVGCSKSPPPLHDIKGKVTLGGKPYYRLLAYFRPVNEPVSQFNMGVGETDKEGNLVVQGNGGIGLPEGEYKVTFTCHVAKPGSSVPADGLAGDDKPSERGVTTVELVPDSHAEGKANDTTTVRFTVKKGTENRFDFDIPVK